MNKLIKKLTRGQEVDPHVLVGLAASLIGGDPHRTGRNFKNDSMPYVRLSKKARMQSSCILADMAKRKENQK